MSEECNSRADNGRPSHSQDEFYPMPRRDASEDQPRLAGLFQEGEIMRRGEQRVDPVDELKIDRDDFLDKQDTKHYIWLIKTVCKRFRRTALYIKRCDSKSKGEHYYIKIKPSVNAFQANFIQRLLGDDPRRVAFNLARIKSGLNEWNKLFEVAGRRLRTIYRAVGYGKH